MHFYLSHVIYGQDIEFGFFLIFFFSIYNSNPIQSNANQSAVTVETVFSKLTSSADLTVQKPTFIFTHRHPKHLKIDAGDFPGGQHTLFFPSRRCRDQQSFPVIILLK